MTTLNQISTPSRIFDFIHYQRWNKPLERAFSARYEGQWTSFSTQQVIEMANALSRGLIQLGVQKGDRIASVVYQNRPEWVIADLAISQIGAINVPVYPTISAREYSFIFNDAGVRICFVGKDDLFDKVSQAAEQTPSLKGIYTFDPQPGRPFWRDLFHDEGQEEVERRREAVDPFELATLIYTSGTTGNPKGVMLSHHNIVSNVFAVKEVLPLDPGDRILSFLPLCHIFERTACYYYTFCSMEVYFAGTDNLGGEEGDIRSVRPHAFTTVPRLLEKVYEKILTKGQSLSGVARKLFFWALSLTEDYHFDKSYTGLAALKRKIADRLIFSKWREALGGEIKGILTGAAACPTHLQRTFSAAGIPVREGYGLTETSPGLAIGRYTPGGALLGAVGPALDGVELRLDTNGDYQPGEGEILASGPNIMMGYYQNEEATQAVFTEMDGKRWFRTGDIGAFVSGANGQQFLRITDRKKELLKTSGGKFIAPTPIESKIKEDFLVEQVMVVGEQQKFVSALIVPSQEGLRNWCKEQEIPFTSMREMIDHPRVLARFQAAIDEVNPLFSKVEQVKKFRLLDTEWAPTRNDGTEAELTPTLKLKRRVILQKYAAEIEAIYEG